MGFFDKMICRTTFSSSARGEAFKVSRMRVHNNNVTKLAGPSPNDSSSTMTGCFSHSSGENVDVFYNQKCPSFPDVGDCQYAFQNRLNITLNFAVISCLAKFFLKAII